MRFDLDTIDPEPIILPGGLRRLATLVAALIIIRLMWGVVHPIVAYGVGLFWS